MLGQIVATFSITESSIRIDEVFFSVAITIPFVAGRHKLPVDIRMQIRAYL